MMYIGIDKDITEDVLLHNVLFSNHFRQNIDEIFNGDISEDPSLYLYVPKVGDATLAPEGQTGLYVLMPTPELKTGPLEWENPQFIKSVKEHIYRKLATIPALEHVQDYVISETILHLKILNKRLMLNLVQHLG